MREKYGKFYADWKDKQGHRRMKAFPTKTGALRHQAKMREESNPKKHAASARSVRSLRLTKRPRRKNATISTPPRKRSARSPEASPQTN